MFSRTPHWSALSVFDLLGATQSTLADSLVYPYKARRDTWLSVFFVFCFGMYSAYLEKLDKGHRFIFDKVKTWLKITRKSIHEEVVSMEHVNKWFGQFHVLRDIPYGCRGERLLCADRRVKKSP